MQAEEKEVLHHQSRGVCKCDALPHQLSFSALQYFKLAMDQESVGKINIEWIEDRLTGSVPLNVSLERTNLNDCAVMREYPESRISILD